MKKLMHANLSHVNLQIKSYLEMLKPAEKKVAKYILQNADDVIHFSITHLANEVGVSEATVVKFCQRIGYSGYQELKILLAQRNNGTSQQSESIYGPITAEDDLSVIINKTFQIYQQSFADTQKILSIEAIEKSVKMILESKKIFFFGYGASGIVAQDAELKFKRIGYQVEAIVDNHTQNTIAPLLNKDDLIIGISDSGKTKELMTSLTIAKETGVKLAIITSSAGSPIAQLTDTVLLTSSRETPFRGSAIASRMAQLAVIDLLFLGVATAKYESTFAALKKTRLVMQKSKV